VSSSGEGEGEGDRLYVHFYVLRPSSPPRRGGHRTRPNSAIQLGPANTDNTKAGTLRSPRVEIVHTLTGC
jgi:hypothetical protein